MLCVRNDNYVFVLPSDPNDERDEILHDLRWVPTSSGKLNYLSISDSLEMRERLFVERFEKWEKLFPWPSVDDDATVMNVPNIDEVAVVSSELSSDSRATNETR